MSPVPKRETPQPTLKSSFHTFSCPLAVSEKKMAVISKIVFVLISFLLKFFNGPFYFQRFNVVYNTPQLLDQKVSDAKLIFVLYYAAFYFKDL